MEIEELKKKIELIKSKGGKSKLGRKPVIFIDQDDVCNNYVENFVDRYNKKFSKNKTEEDVISWDILSHLGQEAECLFYEYEIFKDLNVREHCYEVFKVLFESDLFEMYILSAAHPYSVRYKFDWIKEKLDFFDTTHFVTGCNKNLYKGDILLDDGIHNIEEFTNGEGIIFDRPHNRSYKGNAKRVYDWYEFANYILDKFY